MGSLKVSIRLQPRASKSLVIGWENGVLKARVSAAPVDGAANEALLRLLSETFRVPRSSLSLLQGQSSRNKVIEFKNIDAETERKIKSHA